MSQAKEIRRQIGSIKNTQKITKAMELVAASKMRASQQRMNLSKPYAQKIKSVISHVALSHSEYKHPYMRQPDTVERVGFIVVSSDRGLCGGLNNNAFKKALMAMKLWRDKGVAIESCLIGHKAEVFFHRAGGDVLATAAHLGDEPKLEALIGVIKVMLDRFDSGALQKVFLVSNEFINTMVQKPYLQQLLPLEKDEATAAPGHWDYIYEPDSAKDLLDMLLRRYIESQVYQSVIENVACFQASQMMAMKSATDNASELIDDLTLVYNKARQASITQEIAEVVGGAAAVE